MPATAAHGAGVATGLLDGEPDVDAVDDGDAPTESDAVAVAVVGGVPDGDAVTDGDTDGDGAPGSMRQNSVPATKLPALSARRRSGPPPPPPPAPPLTNA